MTEETKLSLLGSGSTEYRYDHPTAGMLEAFENPAPGREWVVGLDCPEFTNLCPITGQPDFGRILVQYVPDRLCVESKSLKLYLFSYRNHGAFHEACVNQIADDLATAVRPRYLRVLGSFNPRGGISIVPMAVRTEPGLSDQDRKGLAALLDDHRRMTELTAR